MESGGVKKWERTGPLRDLQPNYRDRESASQSSAGSCFLCGPRARSESVGAENREVPLAQLFWTTGSPEYNGSVGGNLSKGMGEKRRDAIWDIFTHCLSPPDEALWDNIGTIADIMQRLCIPPSSRDSVRITMRTSLRSLELNLEFDSCKDTSLRGREALIEDFSDEAHIIYNGITSGIGIHFSTVLNIVYNT